MTRYLLLALLILAIPNGGLVALESAADRMYHRLRVLEGDWVGTFQWTAGREGGGAMRATYTLTGGGSALVEHLFMNGSIASMSTIYHIDAGDLRATHYCLSRTQPRFKATTLDESAGVVQFDVIDVTGSDPPNRSHVQKIRLQLVGPDELKIWFTFGGGASNSGAGIEQIVLRRNR